jgi:hypothetical protein
MYCITTLWTVSSRLTLPYPGQVNVPPVQDVCRRVCPDPVCSFRVREIHSGNVVQCRAGNGSREGLPYLAGA